MLVSTLVFLRGWLRKGVGFGEDSGELDGEVEEGGRGELDQRWAILDNFPSFWAGLEQEWTPPAGRALPRTALARSVDS